MVMKLFFFKGISFRFIQQSNEVKITDLGTILEPQAVPFTFDTIGWKLLFSSLIVAASIVSIRFIIHYLKNTYRRTALQELARFIKEKKEIENSTVVNYANMLLKKMAISIYGRSTTAHLYDKEWLSFLDSKTKETNFTEVQGVFSKASYLRDEITIDERNRIVTLTQKWIQTHA